MVELNFKTVFASFAASCIVLLVLGFLLLGNSINGSVIENKHAEFNFIIPHEQDINLLVTVCYEKPEPADVYILLKISACDNQVCIANIPKNIVTIVDTKRGNLQELFDWGGINCVKEAIENIADVEIDRTIQLDDDGVNEIMQYLKKNNIDNNLNYQDFSEAQFRTLDHFCELLRKDPVNTIIFLNNYFNSNLDLSDFFDELCRVANISISNYDFESRKMGFKQMILNSNCDLVLPKLQFENLYGYDRLTYESKIEFSEVFKKINSIK